MALRGKDRPAWGSGLFDLLGYKPHAGQRPVHESGARFKVHFAGSRMGKSLCAAREVEPLIVRRNTRGWIVGPTYELAEKEFRYIWKDLIEVGGFETLIKHYNARVGDLYIKFAWGAEVVGKSADRPETLLGEELDWLIVSEAAQMSPSIWERYLRARLASRRGLAIFPTTPRGFNWVYDLWLRGQDPQFPEWASWQFPTELNPEIGKEELEEARRTLSPEVYREQFMGEPCSFAGLVYKDFDRALNVIDFEYDGDLPLLAAVDFGYRMPAIVFIQEFQPGSFVIFDEFVEDNVNIERLADALGERWRRPDLIYCDPAGEGANSSGLSDVAHLRARGLEPKYTTAPRWRAIAAGVELVRGLVCSQGGDRSLFIARHLCNEANQLGGRVMRGVWRDIQRYAYPDLKGVGPVQDLPLKDGISDHTMDALRYFAVNRHIEGLTGGAVPRANYRDSWPH